MKNFSSDQKSVKLCFTLIELLVVIAIIAILAGILMPALSSARARGKSAVCISNLKTMSGALQAYADDAKGVIPYQYVKNGSGVGFWLGILYDKKYLSFAKVMEEGNSYGRFNKVVYCPASAYDPPYQSFDKTILRTYGMLTLNGDSEYTAATNSKKDAIGDIWKDLAVNGVNFRFFMSSNVKSPGSVLYFGETSYRNTHPTELERNRPSWQFQVNSTHSSAPHLKLQHNERANVVFFDGHVASQDRYQLREGLMRVKYVNDDKGECLSF